MFKNSGKLLGLEKKARKIKGGVSHLKGEVILKPFLLCAGFGIKTNHHGIVRFRWRGNQVGNY